MTLIECTLWGDRDKVQIAIERLRQFEPDEGYYLAFSGGKDSITIYRRGRAFCPDWHPVGRIHEAKNNSPDS